MKDEQRIKLKAFQEKLEAGQIKVCSENCPEAFKALNNLTLLPNGEINPDSVDPILNTMVNALTFIQDREDMKKEISLLEIQCEYFNFIEINFGYLYAEMLKVGATPHEYSKFLSSSSEVVASFSPQIPEFLNAIKTYWENLSDFSYLHAQDSRGIKAVFGGDLFPNGDNLASKCGVYTDTIYLPDPFLRGQLFMENERDLSNQVYLFLKAGLNLMGYKELAVADLELPIVAIVPDKSLLENATHNNDLTYYSDKCTISHINTLFNIDTKSVEECSDFLKELKTLDDLKRTVLNADRFIVDLDKEDQFALLDDHIKYLKNFTGVDANYGQALLTHCGGRMKQATDLFLKGREIGGTSILTAPTSWLHYSWALSYLASNEDNKIKEGDHILSALATSNKQGLKWLGNVPLNTLIEIRKKGALNELREILGGGVNELVESAPSDFASTSDRVVKNLQTAFNDHEKKLNKLNANSWKSLGLDLTNCLVKGSVDITAVLMASKCPPLAIVPTITDNVIDAPKLKDIPGKIKEIKDKKETFNSQNAVGLLFDTWKKEG